MSSFFQKRDPWGHSLSLWVLVAMIFVTPVLVGVLRDIRQENNVENWLPPDDPQSKVLSWHRESFGIEDIKPIEKTEFNIHDIPQTIVGVIPGNPLASFMSGEMLSIIVFALIVGVSMISISKQSSQPILDLLESVQKLTLKVVSWAMRLAPFAAFGLIAGITSKIGLSAMTVLGAYMLTVVIGLFAMILIYSIIIKTRPCFVL